METNVVKQCELEKKIVELDNVMQLVKSTLYNMEQLIEETIDSNKGIWDGEEARNFKDEYKIISSETPFILESIKKQMNNIKTLIDKQNM